MVNPGTAFRGIRPMPASPVLRTLAATGYWSLVIAYTSSMRADAAAFPRPYPNGA